MALDLKRLGFFVTICESRSLTRAARLSHVTQPVLSYHMAELEKWVGEPLLRRRPDGVEPTEAGAALLVHARGIVDAVDAAELALRERRDQPGGLVSVGLLASIGPTVAPRLLRECRARFPQIELRIAEGTSLLLREGVDADRFDLAVNLRARGDAASGSILVEDLYFVARRGAVDLRRGTLPLSEALDHALLLPPKGHVVRELLDHAAQRHGLTVKVEAEIEGLATLKALVLDGIAPAVLGFGAIKGEHESGVLVASKLSRPGLRRDFILHEAARRPHPKAADKVKAIVIRAVQALAR